MAICKLGIMGIQNDILVVGAGGHSRVIIDTLKALKLDVVGIIDINYSGTKEFIFGIEIIGGLDQLVKFEPFKTQIVLAIGDNSKREKLFNELLLEGYLLPSLIHPTAKISNEVKLGRGVFVNTGVIINAGCKIGDNVLINTGAILDHETTVGSNCHIAPGVKVAGRVIIGNNTFIGIGAVVKDNISIANNAIIGAGTVIISNVESNATYVGVAARRIK